MAVKTYRKTALVTAEQFRPEVGQIPKGVFASDLGDPKSHPLSQWVLDTKEGRHTLRGGDYICTGPAGEQWNVAKEIFEATYEEVSSTPPADQQENERKPLDLNITREWFEKRAALEGDHEIGAGRRTMTLNLTPEEIAELERMLPNGPELQRLREENERLRQDGRTKELALGNLIDIWKLRADAAEARVKALEKQIAKGCAWYWPADDTSSDMCADGVWGVRDNVDLQPGEILHYATGGVLNYGFYAFLEAAEDADSDDEFEVDAPTEEEVRVAIDAELARRAALKGGE